MKDIPVSAAQRIADDYGYHQVVIVARAVGEGGGEHVTTYGADRDHCAVAGHIGGFLRTKVMGWPCEPHEAVASEIAREREHQMQAEGWTHEHDDMHSCGELAQAAACYAHPAPHGVRPSTLPPPKLWPWSLHWWNPKDRRRNLVRAAALIVAEIERLDRASQEAT